MSLRLRALPSLLLALALAAPAALLATPAAALVKTGTMLPDLTLPGADGQDHRLREMARGKVALVVYWSISCPHCRAEMPHLAKLAQNLTGNPFVLLSINGDGLAMAPAAQTMADDHKLPGPVLVDHGPGDSQPAGDALDVVATPSVLVFDKSGKLVHSQETKVDIDKLGKAIRDLL